MDKKIEIKVCEISEMPVGEGLETPLHPKRRRLGQRECKLSPALPIPQLTASSSSLVDTEVEVEGITVRPVAEVSIGVLTLSVPSPARFEECDIGDSAQSTQPSSCEQHPPPHPRQTLPRKISNNNYGSETSSDESGDEESIPLLIPRVYRTALHTLADDDDDVAFDQPARDPDAVPPKATNQPVSLYDFQWRPFPNPPIPPESRRETFTQSNVGPTTPCVDPYDIFVAIWDRQFMEHIASETNRYAQQVTAKMIDNNDLRTCSRIKKWYNTTADELYVYFGLIIAMGVVIKSRLEEYWNVTPDVFCTPGFGAHMTINRFIILNKCLHFSNNEDLSAHDLNKAEAKLFKIQPVLSHLNMKFQSLYTMSQNISLDESLMHWKPSLDINQLYPNKTARVGIKTFEICESQTGYLWRFEIHDHKVSPPNQFEDPLNNFTPATVLRLIHGLENRGHTLWMDSFYNSPCLARRLKTLGFDCVGTLRTNRKFVPQELHSSLTKRVMRPGEITGFTSGDLDIMVWRDNNMVGMISTYHGNAAKKVKNSMKPILILDYNIMMGVVDKKDQMLATYPIERKHTTIWYKKLFRRLLNVSVLNSYIIHHHSSSLTHHNFRISLVRSLLAKHRSVPALVPAPLPKAIQRIDLTHRLAEYPFRVHQQQRQRRRCKVCKKRVQTYCVGCTQTVCMEPCFLIIHK